MGDGIRDVEPEGVVLREADQGLLDFGHAAGPLHEDSPASWRQASANPAQGASDGFHGPGDYTLDRLIKGGVDLAGVDLDPFEAQGLHHFLEESHPSMSAF